MGQDFGFFFKETKTWQHVPTWPMRSAPFAMDAVEQANSGHPGMPMGMADIAEVLWNDFLRTTRPTRLARPRPLRAVQRPRLDAAVCAAAPGRLRPVDR
jgi:hypothetical protein